MSFNLGKMLSKFTAENRDVHDMLKAYVDTGNIQCLQSCTFIHIVKPSCPIRFQTALLDFGLTLEDIEGKTGIQLAEDWLEAHKSDLK